MSKSSAKLNALDPEAPDQDDSLSPASHPTKSATHNSKSKSKLSHVPTSDQAWLVALAARAQHFTDDKASRQVAWSDKTREVERRRGDGREDTDVNLDEEEIDDGNDDGFGMDEVRSGSGYGVGWRNDDGRLDEVQEEEEVGDQVHEVRAAASRRMEKYKRVGKMKAVESDNEALMGKITQLEQLVKQYKTDNAKLTEENQDLQDDLAELSKSVQGMGEGGLSQSDREIRERMFEDMHKLVQKVGILEKRNSVLAGENAKLRTLLDEKTKVAQDRAQEDRPGSTKGLLVPEQDTIESQDLVKMVEDLNSKITHLAKEIQRKIAHTMDVKVFQKRQGSNILDDASMVVGKKFAQFLHQHTTNQDAPRIIIRVAMQAILARICEIGIATWCPHNKTSSRDFGAVYEDIVKTVNRDIAENWRRVTHSHIQLDKVAWKKRAISNLKSIIDLVYFPYLTPTESSLTEYASPLLDPLFYAVSALRSALSTGLVTKTLLISFPTAGQGFEASWMEPFSLEEGTSSGIAPDGSMAKWVMASIALGVDRMTRTGGLKAIMKPKIVLEQPPLTQTVRRSMTVGVGPRVVDRVGRLGEAQWRRSQAPSGQAINPPLLPPRRVSMAGGTPGGRRP